MNPCQVPTTIPEAPEAHRSHTSTVSQDFGQVTQGYLPKVS